MPLAPLSDPERGVRVLAPAGWLLSAGQTRVRVYHRRAAPPPRVYVLVDVSWGGLTARLPPSTPAVEALRSFIPNARPREIGAWACHEEREGDATYANGVRPKDGAFLTFYFHGPTRVLADVGGLDTLVEIADSVQGLPPPAR